MGTATEPTVTGPVPIYFVEEGCDGQHWFVCEHMDREVRGRSLHATREEAEAALIERAATWPDGGMGQGDGPARRRTARRLAAA